VAPGVAGDVASLHSDGNNLTKQMTFNERAKHFWSRRQSKTQRQFTGSNDGTATVETCGN
jgi:hypothetical protein